MAVIDACDRMNSSSTGSVKRPPRISGGPTKNKKRMLGNCVGRACRAEAAVCRQWQGNRPRFCCTEQDGMAEPVHTATLTTFDKATSAAKYSRQSRLLSSASLPWCWRSGVESIKQRIHRPDGGSRAVRAHFAARDQHARLLFLFRTLHKAALHQSKGRDVKAAGRYALSGCFMALRLCQQSIHELPDVRHCEQSAFVKASTGGLLQTTA